ncbi:protein Hook homolog 1 isoform X1 [Monodelphis domestica]|uniref:Hook microtubule tethering protein 1 n=2 Tax=Monodelphis domestica TaxID=13616 RepID=A0A5F8HFR9_MONDO|nr:protein Hook homolog 1 isoform X1 [Monodelphis domestica]
MEREQQQLSPQPQLQLCDSLMIWLQTFNTAAPCKNVQQLTNGVAMAQVLHQIDVAWFDDSWLSRIKEDVGDNWRIKASNLKKVLQGITRYYHEFLGQQISEELIPDLSQITEHSDPTELGRLLQLILGCAVNCEKKQEHIQNIMTLEESVQHVVMTAIQELMSKEIVSCAPTDAAGELEYQLKRALEELQDALAEKEELKQRCQELDMQVTALQDEKNTLVSENEMMNEKLDQLDGSLEDPNTVVAKKYFHAQLQVEQLQEENFRLEAAKDDYRLHCEELEKQLLEFQHRNDELTSLAEETRALKDEIDVLRTTSDKASKLESTVEIYRQKLQDLNDLRRQVKSLQDTNMMYMHNTVSLEEELKKANAARTQLEMYKRQVQDLHLKLSDESKRADTLAFEMKRLEEKHEALLKEKDRLIVQRDALKETNEELRCSQVQQDHLSQAGGSVSTSYENLAAEIMPVEYREVFIRLQHENKMLRLQQEGCENERIAELQEQLEQKHRKTSEMETEQRLSKEYIRGLQQQIEDLQKTLQEQGTKAEGESSSKLKQQLEAHMEKLTEVQEELQKKQELIEDLQPDLTPNAQKIHDLEAALQKKDEDMKAMEERYKIYLEKARNVIRTLDPKLNPASAEIMLLRKHLAEKDRRIEILEGECKVAKFRDYEEKLIVSAWYNKSLAFQKLGMESRLTGGNGSCNDSGAYPPARSFLAQQRHITNTRRNLSVKVPATTSD